MILFGALQQPLVQPEAVGGSTGLLRPDPESRIWPWGLRLGESTILAVIPTHDSATLAAWRAATPTLPGCCCGLYTRHRAGIQGDLFRLDSDASHPQGRQAGSGCEVRTGLVRSVQAERAGCRTQGDR